MLYCEKDASQFSSLAAQISDASVPLHHQNTRALVHSAPRSNVRVTQKIGNLATRIEFDLF